MKKLTLVVIVLVLLSAVLVFIRTRTKDTGGSVMWVSDTNGTLSSHPLDTNHFREVLTVVITNMPK
jgi:hypothetical protein